MHCPYCQGPVALVTGEVIYPHQPDLHDKRFWRCAPCDAYVGCHPGTDKPLGRLANAELRKAKQAAHRVFDPLWKSKKMKRSAAYGLLAQRLGISKNQCHIGYFDIDTCKRVVQVLQPKEQHDGQRQ